MGDFDELKLNAINSLLQLITSSSALKAVFGNDMKSGPASRSHEDGASRSSEHVLAEPAKLLKNPRPRSRRHSKRAA